MSSASAVSLGGIALSARHGIARRTALRRYPGPRRVRSFARTGNNPSQTSRGKTRGSRRLRVVAEQHGISLEDARALFSKRFCKGSGVHLELRETATGRGLVATAPVAPGDVLITVPWREAIHVLEDGYADGDDLRLAMELLHVLDDGDDDGFIDGTIRQYDSRVKTWRTYRPMLPVSTGAAAFWCVDNIRELQFPEAVEKTLAQRAQFNAGAMRHSNDSRTKEKIMWALQQVHSRSFSVMTPRGRARCLVPYVDLFNHRPESPKDARHTDELLQRALRKAFTKGSEEGVHDGEWAGAEPWQVVGLDPLDDESEESAVFQMRSIWAYEPGEEVFITYGHETSAELLTSYGFFPEPNDGEFVKLYEDVQDLIDDDRFVDAAINSPKSQMEKEQFMWSMLAVEAPLAIRPGGVRESAHLLSALRVVHARAKQLAAIKDDDVPRIGHSTFVWTEGDEPCGMWDPDRFLSCFFDESCDSDEWLWDDDDARDRDVTDRAALAQACARCEEILADDFATTLEEDAEMLNEIEEAIRSLSPEEADTDPEGHLEYVAALRYRMSVKRILRDFVSECKRAYGVEAEALEAEAEALEYID